MAMTLNDLKRLDPKKIGSWPILPKLGVLFITLALIVLASYWFDWQHQIEGINQEKVDFTKDMVFNRRQSLKKYVEKFPKAQFMEGKRTWQLDLKADAAFPCACENDLDINDAKRLLKNGCQMVAEGANMPSTPEAVEHFLSSKILFAPGKASNAGGVATSGLEMAQNAMHLSWTREEVDHRLHDIMKNIHKSCVTHGKQGDYCNYVNGANVAGFIKVADAMLAQGVV